MSEERAADFARRFAEYWRAPTPDGLATVLADRVRLVAPMTPTTHTLAEGKRAFASLFELIAEMTAEVHRWGATEDGVLIEFTSAALPAVGRSPGAPSIASSPARTGWPGSG